MADNTGVKISELNPLSGALGNSALFESEQGGQSIKVTLTELLAAIDSHLGVAARFEIQSWAIVIGTVASFSPSSNTAVASLPNGTSSITIADLVDCSILYDLIYVGGYPTMPTAEGYTFDESTGTIQLDEAKYDTVVLFVTKKYFALTPPSDNTFPYILPITLTL